MQSQNIRDAVAILKPELSVATTPTGPAMYEALDREYNQFKGHTLVSAFDFSEAWSSWERHPAGDEVVMLLSGRAEVILRGPDGDQAITLDAEGSYVVVPRGVWHTAKTAEPTRMLFITPGEGTEHADDPEPA
ncbi:MAG: cupin domain-containing protein [Leptospirales bacterium]|jgi:mannose-6-phosphate isomerase-like protein (cupin superfamily)